MFIVSFFLSNKGHLAYINYVRMEHWYNNPVLTGFCEMLIESMFCSQINKMKYEKMAKYSFSINKRMIDNILNGGSFSSRRFTIDLVQVKGSRQNFLHTNESKSNFRQSIDVSEKNQKYSIKLQ